MKTLEIKKVEKDGDCFSVTFKTTVTITEDDFDLDQLGPDICFLSAFSDMVMVAGKVTLKAGDLITDDFGGQPIIGKIRQNVEQADFGKAYRPTVDYRDAFKDQH